MANLAVSGDRSTFAANHLELSEPMEVSELTGPLEALRRAPAVVERCAGSMEISPYPDVAACLGRGSDAGNH